MPFPPPPPPPPPGPSTPILGNRAPQTVHSAGDGRGLLMHSIRQGARLKKTITNDRSSPVLGKVNNVSYSNNNSSNSCSPRNNNNNHAGASDMSRNGIGGLFAGGVPKLKPTGRGYSTNATSHTLPRSAGLDSKGNLSSSQSQDHVHRPSLGDVRNRGPPPQPPPSAQKPSMPTSASDSVLTGSGSLLSGQSGSYSSFSTHNHVNNRSFLHGGSPPSLPSKPPVGGYGKPNVAPKPPGIAPNISSKPSPPPKKQVVNGTFRNTDRPPVMRTHSMRAPRSPPVAPPQGLPFPPTTKNLGSYRESNFGLPSFHQSQDSIHQYRANPPPPRTATSPSNLSHHGTKSAAPQPPPPSTPPPSTPYSGSSRSGAAPSLKAPVARPPPPPLRTLGGVNPPQCPPPPPPTSAPPPPPHRTSPAPPPPSLQIRLAPAVPNSAPPPPPVRNTSIRTGLSACSEIESRFSDYFHLVHEFPTPQPFQGVCKVYNSRTVKQMVTSAAKQQAPQPPMVIQLSKKLYKSNISNC